MEEKEHASQLTAEEDPTTLSIISEQLAFTSVSLQGILSHFMVVAQKVEVDSKPFPPGRNSHASAICNDTHKLYICGGYKGHQTFFHDLWEFDIAKATWKQLIPAECSGPAATGGWMTMNIRGRELWVIGEYADTGRDDWEV